MNSVLTADLEEINNNYETRSAFSLFSNERLRKESFVKITCLSALCNFFDKNGIEYSTKNSMFYNQDFYERTGITDFYINNNLFDLIIIDKASQKPLFDMAQSVIRPDVSHYVFIEAGKDFSELEILGFCQRETLAHVLSEKLMSPGLLEPIINVGKISANSLQFNIDEIEEQFFELLSNYMDSNIDDNIFGELASILFHSQQAREIFKDTTGLEKLGRAMDKDTSYLQDHFLPIITGSFAEEMPYLQEVTIDTNETEPDEEIDDISEFDLLDESPEEHEQEEFEVQEETQEPEELETIAELELFDDVLEIEELETIEEYPISELQEVKTEEYEPIQPQTEFNTVQQDLQEDETSPKQEQKGIDATDVLKAAAFGVTAVGTAALGAAAINNSITASGAQAAAIATDATLSAAKGIADVALNALNDAELAPPEAPAYDLEELSNEQSQPQIEENEEELIEEELIEEEVVVEEEVEEEFLQEFETQDSLTQEKAEIEDEINAFDNLDFEIQEIEEPLESLEEQVSAELQTNEFSDLFEEEIQQATEEEKEKEEEDLTEEETSIDEPSGEYTEIYIDDEVQDFSPTEKFENETSPVEEDVEYITFELDEDVEENTEIEPEQEVIEEIIQEEILDPEIAQEVEEQAQEEIQDFSQAEIETEEPVKTEAEEQEVPAESSITDISELFAENTVETPTEEIDQQILSEDDLNEIFKLSEENQDTNQENNAISDELMSILESNDLSDSATLSDDEMMRLLDMIPEQKAPENIEAQAKIQKEIQEEPLQISQEISEETDAQEQEDKVIKMLFDNQERLSGAAFHDENQEELEVPAKEPMQKRTKMIIAANIAAVFIVSTLAIWHISTKSTDKLVDNSQYNPQMNDQPPIDPSMSADSTPIMDPQLGAIPGEIPSQAGNTVIPVQQQAEISSSIVQDIKTGGSPVMIGALSWEVPETLSGDGLFRRYLQIAGKNIKMNLESDMLNANEFTYNDKIKIAMGVQNNSEIKNLKVVESSGSNSVDKLVLQSIKQTLKYINFPVMTTETGNKEIILVINI